MVSVYKYLFILLLFFYFLRYVSKLYRFYCTYSLLSNSISYLCPQRSLLKSVDVEVLSKNIAAINVIKNTADQQRSIDLFPFFF